MKVIIILFALIACITATNLKCNFLRNSIFGYICEIRNVEVLEGEVVTIEHTDHTNNNTDVDVKMVSFISSSVHVVPHQIFTIFPNMEILDLLDSKMRKWNRDFLKNARNLRRIWLAKNEIEELGDNSFLGAIKLENLVLHKNKLTLISEKAFNGLEQLKSLELQNNLLTTLSGNVFSPLKKLTELNLSENKILKIDGEVFMGNGKLEFLNLDRNNIKELSENLFKRQTNLTVIYLQNNQIEKLPVGLFNGCDGLMELRLDNNAIREIPLGLFQSNKKLKLVNIVNNLVESFDGKILPTGMELLYIGKSKVFSHHSILILFFR